jgi:hypothetical protein
MRRLLRRWAVAPRSSGPAAYFEHMMFAEEDRCTHHQEFLGDPADRKFSGDGSWNPYLCKTNLSQMSGSIHLLSCFSTT